MKLLLAFVVLYAVLDPIDTLTPGENCEMCQIVLRTVFGHFSANVPSRKKLVNQLKHECKRHFNVSSETFF
uniref:Saposin B-type domain-containing protein n=1 Tax=Caenorhabditis tropicalis TaxID=1561998 RepID=A0A1I7UZE5_9PELO